MATDFGKGNRAIAFNPTSAFPLDARTYFESYSEALAKAQTAEEVGSTNTQYHYGMKILVKDGNTFTWYKIVKGEPYLEAEGTGGSTPSVNGAGLPIIATTLTFNSTVSELRDVIRANGFTKDDACIITLAGSNLIMVKINDFADDDTFVNIPIWFDLNNPWGALGITVAPTATIRDVSNQYVLDLPTSNKISLRLTIEEIYNMAKNADSKALPIITTELTLDNTLNDLYTIIRDNGITENDICIVRSTASSRAIDTIAVQILDYEPRPDIVYIAYWNSFSNPLGEKNIGFSYLDSTLGTINETYVNSLQTTAKTVKDAINELNGKTIDKIGFVTAHAVNSASMISVNDRGIVWNDTYEFGDNTGGYQGRVPIVAGENIRFETDSTNKVVKIHSTASSSGGDSPSKESVGLSYTLMWGDEYYVSGIGACTDVDIVIPSTHNGLPVTAIASYAFERNITIKSVIIPDSVYLIQEYAFYEAGRFEKVYIPSSVTEIQVGAFSMNDVLTIYCESEMPNDNWAEGWNEFASVVWGAVDTLWGVNDKLDSIGNAIKDTSTGMPTIRLCSVTNSKSDELLTMSLHSGINFNIEIVSGTLQEGDAIQLCRMKTYLYGRLDEGNKYRKQKLRRFAERVITADDIGKKHLTLSINVPLSDELTKEERNISQAMCHNGRMDDHRVSPIYLRIRRPKGEINSGSNGGGMTVDADFSNIIRITRKYSRSKMYFE